MLIKILTLCRVSMSLSWVFNSVKVGLASGSFFQHFIMIWYLVLFKWFVKDLKNVSMYDNGEQVNKENLQFFIDVLWFRHPVSILKYVGNFSSIHSWVRWTAWKNHKTIQIWMWRKTDLHWNTTCVSLRSLRLHGEAHYVCLTEHDTL